MAIRSVDVLGGKGLGKAVQFGAAKQSVKEGSRVNGFDASCIVYSGAVGGSVAGGTLTMTAGGADGIFIPNVDDKVTFGQMTAGGFAASDQFGGCDVTVLRDGSGAYWSTHVYSSDACRGAVQAVPGGWSIVGTWSSAGYAAKHPDCGGLLVFTFLEEKVKIVTIGVGGWPGTVKHVGLAAMF